MFTLLGYEIFWLVMIIDTHCHYDMMESHEDDINMVENAGDIVIGMTNPPSHFVMGYEHI